MKDHMAMCGNMMNMMQKMQAAMMKGSSKYCRCISPHEKYQKSTTALRVGTILSRKSPMSLELENFDGGCCNAHREKSSKLRWEQEKTFPIIRAVVGLSPWMSAEKC